MCVVVRNSQDVEIQYKQPTNIETKPLIEIKTYNLDTTSIADSIITNEKKQ